MFGKTVLKLFYVRFLLFHLLLAKSLLYCVCSFPPCHFGKLYGVVMSLSAVFSLLQYPCFSLVNGVLGGDPLYVSTWPFKMIRHKVINPACLLWCFSSPCISDHPLRVALLMCLQVNIGLTLLSLVTFIHPISVYLHCRNLASQRPKNKEIDASS